MSQREKTIANFQIDAAADGTKASLPEDAKVWRPLNADIFEMRLKKKADEQAHHRDAMTNRIGVLQNINPTRNVAPTSDSQSNDERKKVRSQERSGRVHARINVCGREVNNQTSQTVSITSNTDETQDQFGSQVINELQKHLIENKQSLFAGLVMKKKLVPATIPAPQKTQADRKALIHLQKLQFPIQAHTPH